MLDHSLIATTLAKGPTAVPSGGAGGTAIGGIAPVTSAYSAGSATIDGAAIANTERLISNIIGFITVLGGLMFLLYFFLGAFNFITAGGDKGKVEKARGEMTNGFIGVVILVAAYSVVGLIGSVIGFDLLDFGGQFTKVIAPKAP